MKAKVIQVQTITFKDGNVSHKVCAVLENGDISIFYSREECKVGDFFQLGIGTDSNNKLIVTKALIK